MKKRRHSNAGVFKNTFFTAHVRQLLLGQKWTATSIQLERDQITDYTARTLSKYGLYSKCLPLDFTKFSRVAIFTEHLRVIISRLPAAPSVLTYMVCLNRPYHLKCFKGCLPQIFLGPSMNTLSQMKQETENKNLKSRNTQLFKSYDNLIIISRIIFLKNPDVHLFLAC